MGALAAIVFIVMGVLLNISEHRGWGWTLIILGILCGIAVIL